MTATKGRDAVATPPRWRYRLAIGPSAVGLLGFAVSIAGIGIPSLWYDETATVVSATRSWGQLWAELDNVDAVHGFYYALMHVVFDVFGYSPLALRMPSALTVGLSAALVVVLGRRLGDHRLGLISGIVFVLLPRITFSGIEGRSYALTALMAVIATLLLLRAIRRGRRQDWIGYAVIALLSVVLFLYLALVIVAHGVALAWAARERTRESTRTLVSWLIAASAAGIASVPFALIIVNQSTQLGWIGPLDGKVVIGLLQGQWFGASIGFTIVGWLLVIGGLVAGVRRSNRFLVPLLTAAITVPPIILIIVSLVDTPIYTPRYLTMSAPFVALAMGIAISAVRSRMAIATALIALLAFAIPEAIGQRLPEAKQGSSWAQVAELVGRERAAEGSDATTAVVWGTVWGHPRATSRVIRYSYPDAFIGTIDPTIRTPAAETGQLWETRAPLAHSLDRLADAEVTYLISSTSRDEIPETTRLLAGVGWQADEQWTFNHVDVVRYVKR